MTLIISMRDRNANADRTVEFDHLSALDLRIPSA
jgi:hypothetical protein